MKVQSSSFFLVFVRQPSCWVRYEKDDVFQIVKHLSSHWLDCSYKEKKDCRCGLTRETLKCRVISERETKTIAVWFVSDNSFGRWWSILSSSSSFLIFPRNSVVSVFFLLKDEDRKWNPNEILSYSSVDFVCVREGCSLSLLTHFFSVPHSPDVSRSDAEVNEIERRDDDEMCVLIIDSVLHFLSDNESLSLSSLVFESSRRLPLFSCFVNSMMHPSYYS